MADVQKTVGDDCIVFGGIASSYWSDELMDAIASGTNESVLSTETALQFVLVNGEIIVTDDALAFLNVYGDVDVGIEYTYGWSRTKRQYELLINGKIIEQINGVDAETFLKKSGHPLVTHKDFVSYPFWIHDDSKQQPYPRDVFYDDVDGVLSTGNSQWTEGNKLSVSFALPKADALEREYQAMLKRFDNEYAFVFSVACSSRVIAQRQTIGKESTAQAATFAETPLLGGYFFGEFFPWQMEEEGRSDAMLHSCSSAVLTMKVKGETEALAVSTHKGIDVAVHEAQSVNEGFLQAMLDECNESVAGLQKQLDFFEGKQSMKDLKLYQDMVAILLHKSRHSVNAHAVELEALFRDYMERTGEKLPYPFTRSRLSNKLNPLVKAGSEKFFGKKK